MNESIPETFTYTETSPSPEILIPATTITPTTQPQEQLPAQV